MTPRRWQPRRLAFHVLTLLAVVVCIVAARWQWAQAHRSEADAVPDTAPVVLTDLDPAAAFSGMRVSAVGRFDARGQVLVAPRARDGQPGAWVLTPLQVADGPAVAVVRGWIPSGVAAPAAPEGQVDLVGVLVADARAPDAVPAGDPPTLQAVDSGALAGHAGYPVRSGWVALQQVVPASPGQPLPLEVTELPGAELGLNWRNAAYAVQWIVFGGFALFFWNRFRRDLIDREQEAQR